jgi:molybdate transport system substrate-binding protein
VKRLSLLIIILLLFCSCRAGDKPYIEVFAGSASKPALDEIARNFRDETGIEVRRVYGGSGSVLSSMILSGRGDIYIPGSHDFMELAVEKGIADKGSIIIIAYLVPVIAVQKGNPKGIAHVKDLLKPGISFAIGDPRTVCVGLYAVEIFDRAGISNDARRSVSTYAENCEKTATLVAFKAVDAVMGWDVFGEWNRNEVDIVEIDKKYLKRAAYIPAAVVNHSQKKDAALKFIEYAASENGKGVYGKLGYIVSDHELKSRYGSISIGGSYTLNDLWR